MKGIYDRLIMHLDAVWPNSRKELFSWMLGPIQKTLPNFRVIRIEPLDASDPWVYVSHGAWEVDAGVEYRMEFFIMSPYETPRQVETLAMLANYHADSRYHLNLGRSVRIGRGWLEESICDHFLVSLPYPYGNELEDCQVAKDLLVKYFWLLPITTAENEYLRRRGLEALEQKFDEIELDFLNPIRRSIVNW